MKVSSVTIAQNEEDCIGTCLASVRDYVDECIVIDGGSTDKTVSIAKSLGAVVFYKDFTMSQHKKNFANQKNYGIVKASSDWVLIIDSDEIIEENVLAKLPVLIGDIPHKYSGKPIECISFPRKNFYDNDPEDKDPKTLFNWPDYQRRLFRNYCRFEGRIHEQLMGFSCEAKTPIELGCIIHRKSRERQLKQDNLYYELRPTDYRERLSKDPDMIREIKNGKYIHDPLIERLAREWFPFAFQ